MVSCPFIHTRMHAYTRTNTHNVTIFLSKKIYNLVYRYVWLIWDFSQIFSIFFLFIFYLVRIGIMLAIINSKILYEEVEII